ncbi:cytochrome b/b6 domain-containing protein [Jiella marina]|uniref:cytochrome b/b6 domain-containing protein n=1 Tax=Jiella sp. LLJ827 TaxID=2917712 RepID=UPI002100A5FB|nr:cytochrome b/b6 domain-containing protein [Jiella sp. LLJ827]MCQ0987719.1 cytochrome b/b6 domain-containing protein [Jiella sp. LLJ827]
MSTDQITGADMAPVRPRPWDPVVRVTHWTIAAAVIVNGLLIEPGGTVHVWIGWIALGTLALRLVWGVIGPREARFTAFLPDPRAAMSHLFDLVRGRPREYPSHNPAGALMAYTLWACLAVVVATGLIMTDGKSPVTIAEENAAVAAGDWSVLVDEEETGEGREGGGDVAEEVHEVAANLMLFLALLHVAGVALESRALGRNLVRGMVAGGRR